MALSSMYKSIDKLDREISNECVVVDTVKTELYLSHDKAKKMQNALMRVHGNREVTKDSIRETMSEIRMNDVRTHDSMYLLLEHLIQD